MKKLFFVVLILMPVSFVVNAQSLPQKQVFNVASKDSVSIAYEVWGQGKTALVFIHGWSCDRSYWKAQLEPFSQKYRVVAIDLGGHGESGLGRQDWSIYSFGNDVAEVVKKLDLQRIILIGHSMGGDVIVDAASQLPGRVAGLVMVDTYKKLGIGRDSAQIEDFINSLQTNFTKSVQSFVRSMFLPTSDPSLVEFVARDMFAAPPAVALSSLRSSFYHSRQITHDLEALNLPVVALNPDDALTDVASMKMHNVEVVIMPNSSHFLIMEDTLRFNAILETVIQTLDN